MLEHQNPNAVITDHHVKAEQDNVYGSAHLYYHHPTQYQQWYQNQYQVQQNWNQMMAMQHVQAQMYPHYYHQQQNHHQMPDFQYNQELKPTIEHQQNINTVENYGFQSIAQQHQQQVVQAGAQQVPVPQVHPHLQAHQITLKKPRVTFSSRQVVRLEQEYSKQR